MIFLQLIQSKNVKNNINIYTSILSLICCLFAIAELKLKNNIASQNCTETEQIDRTCQTVNL